MRAGSEGRSLWPSLAALFEEPDPQFLSDTVEAEISFGLESLGIAATEVRARAASALEEFGLRSLASRAPQSLSAGEKARTLLAAVLAGRPGCLLLDQSLAHLDPGSRRELEERLVQDAIGGGRVVVRTHQESDPPFPGEALHVIEAGALRSLSQLTPRAVIDGASVPYPLALRASAILAIGGRWPGPLAADVEQVERVLRAHPAEGADTTAMAEGGARGRPGPGRGPTALAMNGVAWSPSGPRGAPILHEVDLEIGQGEVVAAIGRSGTGKSTLLKLAAGLHAPSRGSVHRQSPAVSRVRPVALALEYPERQLFGRTVLEDVAALLWVEGIPAEERAGSARRAMREVGLDPERFAGRFPLTLSEGEKRRAALAGVLIEAPRLLLLDEPTAGLDPEGRRSLAAVIAALRERGRTVVLASHDLAFVASVADRVIVLGRDAVAGGEATTHGRGAPASGRILAQGPPADLLRDVALLDQAGIPAPDFIRLERVLSAAGLLTSGQVHDEESLLLNLTRGTAVARSV